MKVVRRGSRRFVVVTLLLCRTGWDKAATRFPILARLHTPHRRRIRPTRLLPPPADTNERDASADGKDDDDKALSELGAQVRAAVGEADGRRKADPDDGKTEPGNA